MDDRNLTMHWHGLNVAASPFSPFQMAYPKAVSGRSDLSASFDYEPHSTIEHAVYHSHVGFQAVSASGPLITEDRDELPYKYDAEHTIFLQDLF
ncbi:hypothetical protein V1527DRAFT_111581 [Lipomyces starkeyi]